MSPEELRRIAKEERIAPEALPDRIGELKSSGCGILQCIIFVRENQQCRLGEATDMVINMPAWLSEKDAFLQHQSEIMDEFIADNVDRIENIQQVITPRGSSIRINMKTDDAG